MRLGLCFLLVTCFLLACTDKSPSEKPDGKDLASSLAWLAKRPVQDIRHLPQVKEFLDQHHVYLSLTTSPKRIRYLSEMLKSIDLDNLTAILINLPERFGRDNSSYTIPPELTKFPKVVINRIPKDLGPITKLVPGIEYARKNHPRGEEDVVITVDDDIGYPRGMVNEMIKNVVETKATVVGGSTEALTRWKLPPAGWPASTGGQVIEGYGAIAYRVKDVVTAPMVEIAAAMKTEKNDLSCYLSDDLVISYVLGSHGIRLQRIDNKYFSLSDIVVFAYGEQDDALHEGAGDKSLKSWFGPGVNTVKYQRCWEYIRQRSK